MGNILDLIGNTPMVDVGVVGAVRLVAKLEYYNPTGSVKDRAALYMIRAAAERGDLPRGGVIIEPTSGNTGIGMAMVARQLGYRLILTMPDSMSIERRQLLAALGAELVLTAGSLGMQGAINRAAELKNVTPNSYIPMQFDNPDNARTHYETTAPEIFERKRLSTSNSECQSALESGGSGTVDVPLAVVCGVGSGGTAMGIKQYITEKKYSTKLVAVEPSGSPLISAGRAGGHKIQGIGANFIPKLLKVEDLDTIITISDEEAFRGARELTLDFGVMSGISGGAAYAAAKKYAEELDGRGMSGEVVFILPDNALKYLSMNIYG